MDNLLMEIDNFNLEEFIELKNYCEKNIREFERKEKDDLKKQIADLEERLIDKVETSIDKLRGEKS